MNVRVALLLALGIAACSKDSGPTEVSVKDGEGGNDAGFSISGSIYGFTGGPDSQRVALNGVVVSVVRLGGVGPDTVIVDPDTSIVDPDTGISNPDSSGVLPDSTVCPITMLCGRRHTALRPFTLDSILPDSAFPPPPASCFDNATVITATTDASGSFTLAGLDDGRYGIKVEPASGSGYSGFSYCGGIALTENRPDPLNFYLAPSP